MSQFADIKTSSADASVMANQIGSSFGFKIGQKFPTPSPGNGDRVFYETLLLQRPDSEMAQEWCLFYGILEDKKAEQIYKLLLKRKGSKMTAPSPPPKKVTTTTVTSSTITAAKKVRKTSKIIDDSEVNDDCKSPKLPWYLNGLV